MADRRCKATTKTGRRCKLHPIVDTDHCRIHQQQDMTTEQAEPGHDQAGYQGRCNALKRQPEVEGERCTLPAGWGTIHVGVGACRKHGGSTRNHVRFAQMVEAAQYVDLFGGEKDISPTESLQLLVQRKACEVDYWRYRVSLLSDEDLTWGTTKVKQGGDDFGTTEEAKPHIALVMLRQAEQDWAAYSSAAIKAGVETGMLKYTQAAAQMVVGSLVRLTDALGLTDDQQARAASAIPEILRSLTPEEMAAA